MGFDVQNFGLGMLSGWASAYLVYRYRHVVKGIVSSAQSQASTAQNAATRSADSRYIGDLVRQCETLHLAGTFLKLTDVVIEPRFLPAPPPAGPLTEEMLEDVFRVVPRVPDLPYLHAPFNVPSLSISDLSRGDQSIALLGDLGSGRTTALMTIALFSLNRVRFQPPTDAVQRLIDEEEAKLPEKERAQRAQERRKLEAQAREKFAEARGVTFETRESESSKELVPAFNRLMPLYASFAWFQFDAFQRGNVDPAELLVQAVQMNVGRITSSTIPGNLYSRLSQGRVLLLLDGFDELSEPYQARAAEWLRAFRHQYQQNFIIVTGSVRGSGALVSLGFTPVYMRPWQDFDVKQLAARWAAVFPRMTGDKKISGARKIEEAAQEAVRADSRCLTPLEITLKIWAFYAEQAEPEQIESWYRSYVTRLIPAKLPIELNLPTLAKLAETEIEEGYLTAERLRELGVAISQEVPKVNADQALQRVLEPTSVVSPEPPSPAAAAVAEQAKNRKSAQNRLLRQMTRSGLLSSIGQGRFRFRHPALTAYLASLSFKDSGPELLAERSRNSRWAAVMRCAALHTPLDRVVAARLNASADILSLALTDAAAWLRYAPADAAWRGAVLKQLTNALLAPSQYPYARERAAAALVGTRDTSILYILRRAARNANAHIRRLACLAMGAMGSPDAISDLSSLLQDKDGDVQLAASLSLGAIATESALEAMVISFTEDSEAVRKAIAEAFAALPDDGHPILYDAVRDQDMMLRRSAIAGIRRIRAGWALAAIYRTFIGDSEWYVKSAAEAAFQELHSEDNAVLVRAYPTLQQIEWVQDWARKRGEALEEAQQAHVLAQALRDTEPTVRALAAETLGQRGEYDALSTLYDALLDSRDEVRASSFKALADLQLLLGKPLPLPI